MGIHVLSLVWCRIVFNSLHGLSHPGIRATQKLVTALFVWPGINADIRPWTRACQCAKIKRHSTAAIAIFRTPDIRFDIIHIDLEGTLPPLQGFMYLVTCVDRFTRWPEAIALTSISAESRVYSVGSHDMVFHSVLSLTVGDNSNHSCGITSRHFWDPEHGVPSPE